MSAARRPQRSALTVLLHRMGAAVGTVVDVLFAAFGAGTTARVHGSATPPRRPRRRGSKGSR